MPAELGSVKTSLDQRTNGRTDGQSLLNRCVDASKKSRARVSEARASKAGASKARASKTRAGNWGGQVGQAR